MTFFELLKEVIVPIISPLVAAIAVIVAVRAEGRKIRLHQSNERRQRIESTFTDCLYARDLFTILTYQFSLGQMNTLHISELQQTVDRVFSKIFSDPEAGRRLYEEVHFTGVHNNIFRLLAELRIRTATIIPNGQLDLFIYFGLSTLLYLYDSDPTRRCEMYEELEKVRDQNQNLYAPLMIDKNTKSLKFSA